MSTQTEKSQFIQSVFSEVPGRIQAAIGFIDWVKGLTDPCQCCNPAATGRALAPRERAAYDAAMDSLRLYFTGEADHAGPSMCDSASHSPSQAVTSTSSHAQPWAPTFRMDGPGMTNTASDSDA